MWPWKGYSSVALFHYNVPDEATRATWEFASFQDNPDCPSRQVHVWIQHGSYPVVNASSTTEFPIRDYYVERSYIEWLTLDSAYKPTDTLVHPVYNPLPGSWFVAGIILGILVINLKRFFNTYIKNFFLLILNLQHI